MRDAFVDADGDSVPEQVGKTVTLQGVLISDPIPIGGRAALVNFQDRSGGTLLFTRNPDLLLGVKQGDMVQATGEVALYKGSRELVLTDLRRIGPGVMPAPKDVLVTDLLGRRYHGELVRVVGELIVEENFLAKKNDAVMFRDRTGEIPILISARFFTSQEFLNRFQQGGQVQLTGIASQFKEAPPYDSGYRLIPRRADDFAFAGIPPYREIAIVSGFLVLAAAVWFTVVRRRRAERRAEAMSRLLERVTQAEDERNRFFNLSLDMLSIANADGYFQRVNPAFTHTLGWSREELLARPFLDWVHPDDRAATLHEIERQVAAGEAVRDFENRYLHKDGSWRVLSWTSVPQPGGIMFATARDVTPLRQAEAALLALHSDLERRVLERTQALQESEERFRIMVGSVTDYAIIMLSSEGHVLSWNQGAERLYGYRADEIVGRHFSKFYPQEEVERSKPGQEVAGALAQERFEHEGWHVRKDGSRFMVNTIVVAMRDAAGGLRGFVKITHDITERKRAEEALRKSEAYYRTLIDAASDGIFVMDNRGRYTDINAAGCAMIGYAREEVAKLRNSLLMAPDEARRLSRELTRLAVGRAVKSEWRIRRKDGSLFYGEINATLLPDGRRLGILRDITERKQAMETLRQKEQEQRALAGLLEIERARLNEAQAVARVGSWEIELATITPNWSAEMHNICETDPSRFHITRASFLNRVHPKDRKKVTAAFLASLSQRGHNVLEHRLVMRDGRIKYVDECWRILHDEAGRPVRVVGTCQDITERRRVEDERQAYERQFEVLFRSSPIAIGWGRMSDGRIADVNRKWVQLFGYEREELVGRSAGEFNLWPDTEACQRALHLVTRVGKAGNIEARLRRKSGEEFEALLSLERLRLGGEDMLVGMLLDVTERNLAQRALANRARLQAALTALSRRALEDIPTATLLDEAAAIVASTLGVEFSDVVERLPDEQGGRLVAGVGWREGLVGRANVAIRGDTLAGFTLQASAPVIVEAVASEARFTVPSALREHGIVGSLSVVIRERRAPWGVLGAYSSRARAFAEDEITFVEAIGHILGTAIGRAKAEQAVRASERDLLLFASATNDTLWNVDFATARVTRSVGFEKHFGYPANVIEPVLEWWSDRVHPDDRARVMAAFRQALEEGAISCSYQYRFRRRDDSYAIVEDRACIVRDESGKPERAIGAMTDVSQRIEQQSAILYILRQLIAAEEVERRRIAKELHDSTVQGLVAAMMNLEFLRAPTGGRTPAEAKQIEDSLALLENCAHEIRTLSYLLHPPRLDEAGLDGAIRHYVAGYGERTGLATRVDLPPDLGRLGQTDELILFRVLQECLGNIHRHAHSKTAAVRLRKNAAEVVLEISDQGRGIPPQVLATPHGATTGLGVGIPGMRERLRQIEGRLEIESSASGTTVRAVVPLKKDLP